MSRHHSSGSKTAPAKARRREVGFIGRLGTTAPGERVESGERAVTVPRLRVVDAVFIVVVAALPALFYTHRLGFYLDDHLLLGVMSTSQDQSVRGLFDALTAADPKAQLRPVVYLLIAAEFRLFGANPLPYHLVLAALVPVTALALYAVLLRLRLPRHVAVATPVLFASAPHYSSAKLWPIVFSPALTLTLALISVYAGLRAVTANRSRMWLWLAAACAAMVTSIFMYEITLPLFAVVALFHWFQAWREAGRWRYTAGVLTGLLAGVLVLKVAAAARVGRETSYGIGYDDGFLHHMGYVVSGAIKVNFGTYGIGLPYVVAWTVANRLTLAAVVAASVVGAAVFAYFARGPAMRVDELPSRRGRPGWLHLAAAGVATVVVGYALFLTGANVFFTSAGIDNRVNIIAAVGMVLVALALIQRGLQLFSPCRRSTAFAAAVAVLAAVGTFITTTIGGYWQEAAGRQRDVLSGLRAALPQDPTGITVILDGTCPEVGPGIVFTSHYDLGGALQTIYREPSLEGVVITPAVTLQRHGIVLTTYVYDVIEPRFYRYADTLVVYDARRRRLHRLPDEVTARAYFASRPTLSCPPLRSFAWGLRTSRYLPFN
jgi:hypothetical protein